MRKKIFLIGLFLLSFFMFNRDVEAACGVSALVGDESVCIVSGSTEGNSAGTAYAEGGTLVLKNYNGGSIKFNSGLGNPSTGFVVKLVGDNYITNENGYGILFPVTGLNFVGDGTLTIKSKAPFVSSDFDGQNVQYTYGDAVTTIKISSGTLLNNSVVEEDSSNSSNVEGNEPSVEANDSNSDQNNVSVENVDESSDNEVDEENDLTTILLIVSSIISALCLIVIIILVIKNSKLKKGN